jgi:hypothetical protein
MVGWVWREAGGSIRGAEVADLAPEGMENFHNQKWKNCLSEFSI